jgi:hypothetical protein
MTVNGITDILNGATRLQRHFPFTMVCHFWGQLPSDITILPRRARKDASIVFLTRSRVAVFAS